MLVVHPFAKSIEAQYSRKEQLFANRNLLPDFELQTLVPPQTIAGSADARYTDWFDALKHLEFEVDSREFDVAIIGCGAYGFPLASHVKRSGRQAIHGGGDGSDAFRHQGEALGPQTYLQGALQLKLDQAEYGRAA